MWKAVASTALTLFVVLLAVAAGVLAWGRDSFNAAGPMGQAICFKLDRGMSLSEVSDSLDEKGAISSQWLFRIGAEYSGKAGDLKFGSYLIPAKASMAEVLEALTVGGQSTCGQEINFRIGVTSAEVILRELDPATNRYEEVAKFDPAVDAVPDAYVEMREAEDMRFRVTLAEGVTSWMVVEQLKRADFLTGEVAAVPPEGSLAPDSYEVVSGDSRADLIARMQAAQVAILAQLWAERAEGLPYDTPEEALVMASIVEKETGIADERPRVASVFVNRMRQGMRLQTDPTVIYGVTGGQAPLGRGLRQSELRRETPYNTYVIDGLPPTPIANPGKLSIEAAVRPAVTDDLFFVADGTGGHAFATNLEDHNKNVARWREIEAQQGADSATGVQGD